MQSLITPLALIFAISAMSVSVHAQQAPLPAAPGQTTVGTSVTQTTVLSDIGMNQILGLPTSHCGHVIDLLHANRFRQGCGQLGDFPNSCSLPHEVAGTVSGDLALGEVLLISDGTPVAGPVFDIALCNHSQIAVGSFRISVVGVLGRIHVHSPTTTVRVSGMNVGQELHVQVQLPATCMTMGPPDTQPAPFDRLVVAIDSFDEWAERDELNNVRVINRSDIGLLVADTTTVVAQDTDSGATVVPSAPPAESTPSPEGSIDLDDLDLDLEGADESAIRFGDALR